MPNDQPDARSSFRAIVDRSAARFRAEQEDADPEAEADADDAPPPEAALTYIRRTFIEDN